MKRYNLINNILGWVCFFVAALTYMLTLEPTASFWDCPEFIIQADKLEIGHPPGNPIFMLTARFFINFVGGDISKVAVAVNAMSGLLSAATILLLFWTVTHLVKRLVVDDNASEVSLPRMLVIFGSGVCGALMYAWSDTFWFSAVEGEVYAFSSFCTALVFWLILKWQNRADSPRSDRYLVLIAYIIGVSIGVHLLNLLCIPAIVLVFYYTKWRNTTAGGSLIALLVSFVIVAIVLYGLVPGFIKMAQYFELLFVNGLHCSYNVGTLVYAVILLGILVWTLAALRRQQNSRLIRILCGASIVLSGIPLMVGNIWLAVILSIAIFAALFLAMKRINIRVLSIATLGLLVIFIGYSSYALLLVRSNAATPMNQNAPDNVFSLSSYLNREQYGERPLFYGVTPWSAVTYQMLPDGTYKARADEGDALYAKVAKEDPSEPDSYVLTGHKKKYNFAPELDMLFPRIYSSDENHRQAYTDWIGMKGRQQQYTLLYDVDGNPMPGYTEYATKPTMAENLKYFFSYQLNYMYWRYFMWNFAGRQNDIQGNGEVNHGNWISGIPFVDNPRLGDQSKLPWNEGEGNPGNNKFYLIPLIMGIIGLLWQAFVSKRGIEQFWVIFFLFFMTGIAIVIYLNQTPQQPRERDYAYAGSFYAFAVWVGMGVAAIWHLLRGKPDKEGKARRDTLAAVLAAVVGILVPLQVVSQTWDDHDRSGRYTTRDFGMNYLNSLDDNAIIFTNGDNDTFPLWYAQEVEGVRTDVKVVNLSYLTTDWYANQIRRPSYDAKPIDLLATPQTYAYDRMQYSYVQPADSQVVHVRKALEDLYSGATYDTRYNAHSLRYPRMYLPVDADAMVRAGRIKPEEAAATDDVIPFDFSGQGGVALNTVLALDMLYNSARNGWDRPIYFAMTVPAQYYLGLSPYMRNTGLAYEVGAIRSSDDRTGVNTDKMYENVTKKFRWGGLEGAESPTDIYLDETVRRMVSTNRSAIVDLADALIAEGLAAVANDTLTVAGAAEAVAASEFASDRMAKAAEVLDLMEEKLPSAASPYSATMGLEIADAYLRLGDYTGNPELSVKGHRILRNELDNYSRNFVYYTSLTPGQFATLQDTDKYIFYYYIPQLVQEYITYGGDYEELEKDWMTRGVNQQQLRQLLFSRKQSSGSN
ncbi:MAG: DUF2723 domain-containing protein [Clostridium sp.]|nr:DUF2723 domain-containing protein [Clostridium sp.]